MKLKKPPILKKGTVFDISQTNATADDLPKIFPEKTWDFDIKGEHSLTELQVGVNAIANSLKIEIKDMSKSQYGELGVARGAYIKSADGSEEIVLNSRNTITHNISTAIHELAHKKFDHLGELFKTAKDSNPDSYVNRREIQEFQAELVSYIVCLNYKMDTADKAIPYIAHWTKNHQLVDLKTMKSVLNDVRVTAQDFIQIMDGVILSERQQTLTNTNLCLKVE